MCHLKGRMLFFFFKDKLGLVDDSIRRVEESLENRQRQREKDESWYQNLFSTSPMLTTLLPQSLRSLYWLFAADFLWPMGIPPPHEFC